MPRVGTSKASHTLNDLLGLLLPSIDFSKCRASDRKASVVRLLYMEGITVDLEKSFLLLEATSERERVIEVLLLLLLD